MNNRTPAQNLASGRNWLKARFLMSAVFVVSPLLVRIDYGNNI